MSGYEHLCMNCMSNCDSEGPCPNCGFSEQDRPQAKGGLPYRTVLQDRYMLGRVVRSSGEGFVYIAYDMQQLCRVEIREFFPRSICVRMTGSSDVAVIAGHEADFDRFLNGFIAYQQSLLPFRDQPALIPVLHIFEENYTAYAVSAWEESITLRNFLGRSGGPLSWNAAWKLFRPVILALSALHASGIGHLGISPDTLFIMQDGGMKLGDFCIPPVHVEGQGLPAKPPAGSAALEQFGGGAIDESTDVYGLASSLFFVLTGELPKDARKRRGDPRLLLPGSILRSIPPHVITALANALQVLQDSRTPTFERLRAELSAAPTATVSLEETQSLRRIPPAPVEKKEPDKVVVDSNPQKHRLPPAVWGLLAFVAVLLCAAVGYLLISSFYHGDALGSQAPASAVSAGASASVPSLPEENASLGGAAPSALSSAVPKVPVPNLVGKRYSSLERNPDYQVLLARNEFSDSIEEGCIISQTPATQDGVMVKGTAISVVVSRGKALRELPKVAGLTYADARKKVEAAGFLVSSSEQNSDSVAKGVVIGYEGVQAGGKLNYNSKVTLLVSAGPASSSPQTASKEEAP